MTFDRSGSHARGPIRLGLLANAPMYYHAPVYRMLASHPAIDFTAIFASHPGLSSAETDKGSDPVAALAALKGYRACFLRNAARNPKGQGLFSFCDLDAAREIASRRFDVLWLHGYKSITHLLAACTQRVRGGRLLFREEQTLLPSRPVWKKLAKEIGLRLFLRNVVAVYIGTENRRWLQHYGLDDSRLFFSPYCVDNEHFQEAAKRLEGQRSSLRRRFGIANSGGPVILSVCRLIPEKRVDLLLEAFGELRSKTRCALLLVGSGPLESELREKIAKERIPDVFLAGFLNQSEVSEAYACADLFVLTSQAETWGLVVNEAMNFGLPIVATDAVGCHADLVLHGKTGFVVPRGDIGALRGALSALVEAPELRSQMGTAARQQISQWDHDAAFRGVIAAVAAAVGQERWLSAEAANAYQR
jgi:glycosyltransferase involved in cell wall biosynthesis